MLAFSPNISVLDVMTPGHVLNEQMPPARHSHVEGQWIRALAWPSVGSLHSLSGSRSLLCIDSLGFHVCRYTWDSIFSSLEVSIPSPFSSYRTLRAVVRAQPACVCPWGQACPVPMTEAAGPALTEDTRFCSSSAEV